MWRETSALAGQLQAPFLFSFTPASSPVPAPEVPTIRALLVDDEPLMLTSLAALLESRNFDLTTANCGSDAIQLLRRNVFDLVILDLQMPDVGGHAIMDFMKTQRCEASIIVTSGAKSIDAAIGALKRGAYDYLRKPYTREELEKTIDNILQHRALQAENRRIATVLDQSEKMYRFLVDRSPDIIYTLDSEGCLTFINDRVEQVLGFVRRDLIGQHYSVLVHEDDLEQANYVFNERRNNRRVSRNVELRLKSRHGNGEARFFNHEVMMLSLEQVLPVRDPQTPTDALLGIYGVARDITDRKRADELIAYQAYHDILTELPNRVLFKDRLGLALLQAKRNESSLAVVFIDLDRFKIVNDTLGHSVGDELLKQAAARLKACLRRCDTLSRRGGDEFTAVLPDLTCREDAALIAENFAACLRKPFELAGQQVHLSGSIGISVFPSDGGSADVLLKNADVAMYHMKSRGKDGHCFFEPSLLESSSRKIELEQHLHVAIEHGELEMYYQPQVDVQTKRIIGAEALMRWNHPQRGFLSAGEFLPIVEESQLMIRISDWMLDRVCRDLLEWNQVADFKMRMSVNLSPQYLDRGDFYTKLQETLSLHHIAAAQIEVEVTESICIHNPKSAIEQLDKLCQLGVSVAIDDFGTGYSSLSYLHRFPIHTIKIDRSFVMEIHDAVGQFPVVLAIISIAKGLGLNLVAEGVETHEQEQYLENSGCHIMQGYLYHKPISQATLLDLLRSQNTTSNVEENFSTGAFVDASESTRPL
jgi:diguanylate cyclase (GGDEF)-like protein/PAS domain S-box-containing protein